MSEPSSARSPAVGGVGDLPPDIQYVWHGVNDAENLRQFALSPIEWGEIDVRLDADTGMLVAHHDPLINAAGRGAHGLLTVEEFVKTLLPLGKSFKFDLKEGGRTLRALFDLIRRFDIPDGRLWFNSYIEQDCHIEEFPLIRSRYPGAIRQCPIGPLRDRFGEDVKQLRGELAARAAKGMNRFSVAWRGAEDASAITAQLESSGYEVNIYDIPDLAAFLQAVLIKPRSLTADFNFPEWGLFGRGSGEGGRYHTFG
ncbi:MAG: hypothetical protein HY304_00475 [candidate division Zixibacteria bacterium]|nr:hypothetical protein [candidate division Zixibacteria bacterium]